MPNTLHDHRPDWYTRRCVTCTAPWPCRVARVLLLAFYLDAPRALCAYLVDLLRVALEVRDDDADELPRQLIAWAFPRRGFGRRRF